MSMTAVRWTPADVAKATATAVGILIVAIVVILLIIGDDSDSFGTGKEFLGVTVDLWLIALQQLVFVFAAWRFSVSKYRLDIRSLGFAPALGRRPYLKAFAGWIIVLIAISAWALLIDTLGIDSFGPNDNVDELVEIGGSLAALILVVGVWGPLSEEIFFRGFVLPGLVARFGERRALIYSAALFALFHIDPTIYVPIFIFGIVLGWLYLNTRSIWPAVALHTVHNIVVLLFAV